MPTKPTPTSELEQVHDLWIRPGAECRCVEIDPVTGCHNWTGPKHRQGYGMIGAWRVSDRKKLMVTVHRIVARKKYNRAIPSREMVLHTCSNMSCVNPDHLIVGGKAERHQIMSANDRYEFTRRPRKPRKIKQQNREYKYSKEDMLWIRTAPTKEICQKFNLTSIQANGLRHELLRGYRWLNQSEN